ncbi:hypothetical protein ACJMK2_028259 [Sinanodonta woodiana]|uniref:Death domain-containing protein n=1 Tax=Sinanodonta woodiana TaxID=1069815 RepID=A0ABD3X6I5_SINWO
MESGPGDSKVLYDMKLTPGMAYIYGPDGRAAHEQALKHDKDKSYRLVVNIVGKVRQGKTSLRRMLIGEDFNKHEMSTVGIEHDLVETLGMNSLSSNGIWPKIDFMQANTEECDLIVGKHVQERLKKKDQGRKTNLAILYSYMKSIILSYVMLYMYFSLATSDLTRSLPWFSVMLILGFAFSGFLLFDTVRDGFSMAVGQLCLVIYTDSLLRWRTFDMLENFRTRTCFSLTCFAALLFYAFIHAIFAFSMGTSIALGFCFILCVTESPWTSETLDSSPFSSLHLHLFVMMIINGIWSIRFPKILYGSWILVLMCIIIMPRRFSYTLLLGLGCGYSHSLNIKLGFDVYVRIVNPVLKKLTVSRRLQRLYCYAIGTLPGILIVYIFQWKFSGSLLQFIFGFIFIAFIELCHLALEGKVKSAPKASMKNATKVLDAQLRAIGMKIVIRDFAGHPLYHSVHHIYMMGHCVYMIVFSLVEAKRNFKYSITEILYWLQAIYVHDKYPAVRAFIVGTNRDDPSISKNDLADIGDRLIQSIPRQFHNMIVWNPKTDKPLYLVENSIRDEKDPDHVHLREQVLEIANDHMKPKYPIRYLYFFRVINEFRTRGKLIETLDQVMAVCQQNECHIDGPGELEDLLLFFHESGEVIYNTYDNSQNQMVVLDPRALVDIMKSIVRPPSRADRDRCFLQAWQDLDDTGIITERLLKHILEKSPIINKNVSIDSVINLLEYLDLLCYLNLCGDGRNIVGDRCYLLPALLKDILPYPQNYWEDVVEDFIFYVDFGPVVPKYIFIRLVCQCTAESDISIGTDGRYHLNACSSKALFSYQDSCSYKLELFDVSENTSPSQQLLKIVIRGNNTEGRNNLAESLCNKISNIVVRDFNKCRYKVGILCPYEGLHDFCQYEEKHIIPLYESSQTRRSFRRLDHFEDKELWCRGRPLIFRNGQVLRRSHNETGLVNAQFRQIQRQRSTMWNSNILDLPSRLYSDICDDLNIPNALGKDWTGLAGELGKSARDVELLQLRSPHDPCDALLQDWAATPVAPVVLSLVEKLRTIGRFDVIRRIEEFINSS